MAICFLHLLLGCECRFDSLHFIMRKSLDCFSTTVRLQASAQFNGTYYFILCHQCGRAAVSLTQRGTAVVSVGVLPTYCVGEQLLLELKIGLLGIRLQCCGFCFSFLCWYQILLPSYCLIRYLLFKLYFYKVAILYLCKLLVHHYRTNTQLV